MFSRVDANKRTGSRKRQKTSHHMAESPGPSTAAQTAPPPASNTATTADPIAVSVCADPTMQKCTHKKELDTLGQELESMKQLVTCKICQRFLAEPYGLACGHTYCYICLDTWLVGQSKNTCPECRAVVKQQPVPSFVVREMVNIFSKNIQMLPEGETLEELEQHAREAADKVARDKDTMSGGLFSMAPGQSREAVYDHEDHVERCAVCFYEVEDGMCSGCGRRFGPSHTWPDSDDDDDDDDDELDHDIDLDDSDVAFDWNRSPGRLRHGEADTFAQVDQQLRRTMDRSLRAHHNAIARLHSHRRSHGANGAEAESLINSESEEEDDDDDEDDSTMNGFVVDDDAVEEENNTDVNVLSSDSETSYDREATRISRERQRTHDSFGRPIHQPRPRPSRATNAGRPVVLSDSDDEPVVPAQPRARTSQSRPTAASSSSRRARSGPRRDLGAVSNELSDEDGAPIIRGSRGRRTRGQAATAPQSAHGRRGTEQLNNTDTYSSGEASSTAASARDMDSNSDSSNYDSVDEYDSGDEFDNGDEHDSSSYRRNVERLIETSSTFLGDLDVEENSELEGFEESRR